MTDITDLVGNVEQFPVLGKWNFLNHAGVSPMPHAVAETVRKAVAQCESNAYLGADWFAEIAEVKDEAARLINADRGDIALVKNTSEAVSIVAQFPKDSYWNQPGPVTGNLNNGGPHGFSEMLYAYSSASENNGSAFAGINANTPWMNLTTGMAMLFGRFMFIVPLLAVAGSLAAKKKVPDSAGTLPTHGPLFVGLLVGTVVVVGALTFFPALALGPIVEHFLMHQGKLFSLVLFGIGS